MLNKSCLDFIDELGSKAPVPGGGSVSALVGALGVALGTMVGELTTGKKKYEQHEQEITELIKQSRELTKELEAAVEADVKAFEPLAKAYKMSSVTDAQKRLKEQTIQDSLKGAAEAPLKLAELCVKALRVLDKYSYIGSRIVISDIGTGTAFCKAALQGAKLNVLVNLRPMKDLNVKAELEKRLNKAVEEGNYLADATFARIEELCR